VGEKSELHEVSCGWHLLPQAAFRSTRCAAALQPFLLLVLALCGKLKESPFLVDLFVEHAQHVAEAAAPPSPRPRFLLLDAALVLVTSQKPVRADPRLVALPPSPCNFNGMRAQAISRRAREALLVCSSLGSPLAAAIFARHSSAPAVLADHFVQLYVEMPMSLSDTSSQMRQVLGEFRCGRAPFSWPLIPP
jgi:hypothetical protein